MRKFTTTFGFTSLAVLAASALLSHPQYAHATVNTYFGIDQGTGNPPTTPVLSLAAQLNFIASSPLSSVGVENFESQTVGSYPSQLNFTGTTVTAASSSATSDVTVSNTSNFGAFPTSGSNYLYSSQNRDDTFTFNTPVAGFGFYDTDLSDGSTPADNLLLTLTLSDGSSQQVTTNVSGNNNNANVLFFGVTSDDPSQTITKVEITKTNPDVSGADVEGIDDVTVLTATPEPASLSLLALAAPLLLKRRKK